MNELTTIRVYFLFFLVGDLIDVDVVSRLKKHDLREKHGRLFFHGSCCLAFFLLLSKKFSIPTFGLKKVVGGNAN